MVERFFDWLLVLYVYVIFATEFRRRRARLRSKVAKASGAVASVDAKAGTLTIKTKEKTLKVNAESQATKAALEKIKVDTMVDVSYTENCGKLVATKLEEHPVDDGEKSWLWTKGRGFV